MRVPRPSLLGSLECPFIGYISSRGSIGVMESSRVPSAGPYGVRTEPNRMHAKTRKGSADLVAIIQGLIVGRPRSFSKNGLWTIMSLFD